MDEIEIWCKLCKSIHDDFICDCSDVRRRAPKVNLRQMEAMVDFMSQRPDFATSFKADYQSEQLWETLGQVLAEFGPEKHINQWKKVICGRRLFSIIAVTK